MLKTDTVTATCAWETGLVFLDITRPDGTKHFADMSRDDALLLSARLVEAVRFYDEMEALCKLHDEQVENPDGQ